MWITTWWIFPFSVIKKYFYLDAWFWKNKRFKVFVISTTDKFGSSRRWSQLRWVEGRPQGQSTQSTGCPGPGTHSPGCRARWLLLTSCGFRPCEMSTSIHGFASPGAGLFREDWECMDSWVCWEHRLWLSPSFYVCGLLDFSGFWAFC